MASMTAQGYDVSDVRRCETPPPPPPPKDVLSPSSVVESYFSSSAAARPESIYSLSRASFTHQLSQLTSLNLPDASSLSATVAAIPTAQAATRALSNAAVQIQRWITKAEEVLGGLDADDDVEWAAAGGRDGLEDVDNAIAQFERLVQVYVLAIEDLQKRPDMSDVAKAESKQVLDTLDSVISAWANVGKLLKEVKRQVELALEWEELWNTVLGDIGMEMEALTKLIFEMEEKRNRAKIAEAAEEAEEADTQVDLQELETIVEDAAAQNSMRRRGHGHQLSLVPTFPGSSPLQSPGTPEQQEDSSLLALFARMQPLRASLDFLPMSLASYKMRAEATLPSACEELEGQKSSLETRYHILQADADRIRKELGEDQWVAVFKSAGKQVEKMCGSIERGIVKIHEALNTGSLITNPTSLTKKISDYEAKKINYSPNIQKVIAVIDGGVRTRETTNGHVLRIRTEVHNMWITLQGQMKEVDAALDELAAHRKQPLRDSMSSVVSNDVSFTESAFETPLSSPSSSIVMSVPQSNKRGYPATQALGAGSRNGSVRSSSGTRPITSLRKPSATSNASLNNKRVNSYSSPTMSRLNSASPSPGTRPSSRTPTQSIRNRNGSTTKIDNRPRWNSSPVVEHKDYHNTYKPLSTHSPHTRSLNGGPVTPKQSVYSYRSSSLTTQAKHQSSPLARDSSPNPRTTYRPRARAASSMSFRPPSTTGSPSPGRSAHNVMNSEPQIPPRKYKPSSPASSVRIPSVKGVHRMSLLPVPSHLSIAHTKEDEEADDVGMESPSMRPRLAIRPATTMSGNGRRNSLLPLAKGII